MNPSCEKSDSHTYKWLLLDDDKCWRMSVVILLLSVHGGCDNDAIYKMLTRH